MSQCLAKAGHFFDRLLLLVHLTSRYLTRGTELVSVQHGITHQGCRRSVLLRTGLLALLHPPKNDIAA